jgi:hypothetical protein
MGKRLVRYRSAELFGKANEFINKQGNVVLLNGVVFMGEFLSFNNDILTLKDFGKKKHEFNLSEISELILDFQAPY